MFRTNTDNNRKTEMLVLITPYIVADDHDAQEITDAFRNQLGEWAKPKISPALLKNKVRVSPHNEKPNIPAAPKKSDLVVPPISAPSTPAP